MFKYIILMKHLYKWKNPDFFGCFIFGSLTELSWSDTQQFSHIPPYMHNILLPILPQVYFIPVGHSEANVTVIIKGT